LARRAVGNVERQGIAGNAAEALPQQTRQACAFQAVVEIAVQGIDILRQAAFQVERRPRVFVGWLDEIGR